MNKFFLFSLNEKVSFRNQDFKTSEFKISSTFFHLRFQVDTGVSNLNETKCTNKNLLLTKFIGKF